MLIHQGIYDQLSAKQETFRIERNTTSTCLSMFGAGGALIAGVGQEEISAAQAARATGQDPATLSSAARCIYTGYDQLSATKARDETQLSIVATGMNSDQLLINGDAAKYDDLQSRESDDYAAINELQKSWWPAAEVPYDLLILLLAMFMGALGGIMRVLRDYGHATVTRALTATARQGGRITCLFR
jgi:hypothetical protein